MDGQPSTPRHRRTTRRPAGKTTSPDERPPDGRSKRTLVLSDDAWRRLSVHAAMTGRDRSEIMEGLILESCRRFVVQDRGGAGQGGPDKQGTPEPA